MPNEIETLTPATDGTEAALTPAAGTGDTQPAVEPTPPTAPPADPIDYKSRYADSTREAQRLYQENLRKDQIIASMQVQQPAPRQAEAPAYSYDTLTDGVLERDPNKMKSFEDHIINQAEQRTMNRIQQTMTQQQRVNASFQVVQDAIKDPQSAIAQATMANYYRMLGDPVTYGHIENHVMDIPTPQGIQKINPFLLREAVLEAKAGLGQRLVAADLSARAQGDTFVETGSRPNAPEPAKFNSTKHLSPEERQMAENTHQNLSPAKAYEAYWKYLDPGLKEERLKQGRPISRRQLR